MAAEKQVIRTLEMHTGGEPLRIVLSGRNTQVRIIISSYMHTDLKSSWKIIFRYATKIIIYTAYFVQVTRQWWAAQSWRNVATSDLTLTTFERYWCLSLEVTRTCTERYWSEKDMEQADMAVLFMHNEGRNTDHLHNLVLFIRWS